MSVRLRALLPVTAILFGLTACTGTPATEPVSSGPTAATPASTAATPAPNTTAPAGAAPATSGAVATEASDRTAGGAECPSAKTLAKLADLPKDWHFVPSSVECWKGWATADPEGPTPGDGVYLFRYQTGTGWRYHSQGSGFDCKDLGIHEDAPFCQYP